MPRLRKMRLSDGPHLVRQQVPRHRAVLDEICLAPPVHVHSDVCAMDPQPGVPLTEDDVPDAHAADDLAAVEGGENAGADRDRPTRRFESTTHHVMRSTKLFGRGEIPVCEAEEAWRSPCRASTS
jgi:hypothetical protein